MREIPQTVHFWRRYPRFLRLSPVLSYVASLYEPGAGYNKRYKKELGASAKIVHEKRVCGISL